MIIVITKMFMKLRWRSNATISATIQRMPTSSGTSATNAVCTSRKSIQSRRTVSARPISPEPERVGADLAAQAARQDIHAGQRRLRAEARREVERRLRDLPLRPPGRL